MINIVEMIMFSKAIYTVKANSMNNPANFFTDLEKTTNVFD